MKYIMNADDFGRGSRRTEAIDACMREGLIQRASLVVNMESTILAAELAREGGYTDRVCFHLNLTTGVPLTEAIRHSPICYPSGSFFNRANNEKIQARCLNKEEISKIRQECEAQMRKFRELGFTSTHMDSHLWCMCNLPVWLAVRPLIKKYGFRTVRTMKGHIYSTNSGRPLLYYKILQFLIRCHGIRFKEAWAGCPDEFMNQIVPAKKHPRKPVEIYVHPFPKNGIPTDIVFSYQWEKRPVAEEAALFRSVGAIPVD